MTYDDYADEEWVEDEGDDDDCRDASVDLLACPNCRCAVHEDTQQCPHCGDWIVPVWPQQTGKRLIWIVAAGLVILAMIMMAVL